MARAHTHKKNADIWEIDVGISELLFSLKMSNLTVDDHPLLHEVLVHVAGHLAHVSSRERRRRAPQLERPVRARGVDVDGEPQVDVLLEVLVDELRRLAPDDPLHDVVLLLEQPVDHGAAAVVLAEVVVAVQDDVVGGVVLHQGGHRQLADLHAADTCGRAEVKNVVISQILLHETSSTLSLCRKKVSTLSLSGFCYGKC